MAISMTGFGRASGSDGRYTAEVEVRTLNNRGLKVRTRTPGSISALEGEFEAIVRKRVIRGAVDIWVKVTDIAPASAFKLNMDLVRRYREFADTLAGEFGAEGRPSIADYLALDGVVVAADDDTGTLDRLRDLVSPLLEEALDQVHRMREQEGAALAQDISQRSLTLGRLAQEIASHASEVVEAYRDRLLARVRELLAGSGAEIAEENILREVSIFAERSDISEELARIESHLRQLDETLLEEGDIGRKLEFVAQELHREINTIGSKANDAAISRLVVDAKGEINKIREQTANIE